MIKMEKESILGILIVVGLIMITTSLALVYFEIRGAKEFCDSINGTYSFTFIPPIHYCDHKQIVRYSSGWNFPLPDLRNISINLLP